MSEAVRECAASRACVETALRLARETLAPDKGRLAEKLRETRARYLAFAALRGVAPQGRAVAQAEACGFGDGEKWSVASGSNSFRKKAREAARPHWHDAARVEAIMRALGELIAREDPDEAAPAPAPGPSAVRVVAPVDGARVSALPMRRVIIHGAAAGGRRVVEISGAPAPGRSALDRLKEARAR